MMDGSISGAVLKALEYGQPARKAVAADGGDGLKECWRGS